MTETTQTIPVANARKTVEEHLEFARRNGASACQVGQLDQTDRRATLRMFFMYPIHYCPSATLSEDHAKAAIMLDISLDGVGFRCYETLTKGMVVHIRLPLMDGKTGWVKGMVIHCRLDARDYQVGVAFIFGQE